MQQVELCMKKKLPVSSHEDERTRVMNYYAKRFLALPQSEADRQQIVDHISKYVNLPKTAYAISLEIFKEFPSNIFCQAQDTLMITSTISNLFKQNKDMKLDAKRKKGGTWSWKNESAKKNSMKSQASTPTSPVPTPPAAPVAPAANTEGLGELTGQLKLLNANFAILFNTKPN